MKELERIEAALYASGRPLTIDELSKVSGVKSRRKLLNLLRKLEFKFDGAIEVRRIGNGFVMQLKDEYRRIAKSFGMKPLLSKGVLKTLSQVAFYQPIKASELSKARGSHIYYHLKRLVRLGLVKKDENGEYVTTPLFSEQFGLSKDPNKLKKQLKKIKDLKSRMPKPKREALRKP